MRFQTLAEWLAWQEALHPQTIDLGLGRVAQVHRDMGMPGREAFTITVGGTNGKGSCVAMLDSILRSAGYKVATYTSPHILRYNERICVAGRPVDDSRICAAFERIDQARGDVSLSFFEFGTLAALDIFSGEDLEVQLLEVGLGGRLDAVNLIDADISLIASIDIDHQDWLGDTREAIGYEKAGIFRKDRPAVLGDPSAPFSVIRHAEEQGVPLYRLGEHFRYETTPAGWTWSGAGTRLENLPVPAIPGEHQLMNASAVLQALDLAAAQRPVSREAIEAGLRGVNLPGRFQLFPGEVSVLLDVAHNPQAVRILARHLRAHYPGKRIHAVFSVMRDKDIAGIVATIRELIDDWHLAPLKMARAAVPEELAAMLHGLGVGSVHADYDDAGEAFASARRTAQNGDLILVFGSFFLVSEYLVHAA
jgi:dihydrofolate synthase/folylpolyglutamate synthase